MMFFLQKVYFIAVASNTSGKEEIVEEAQLIQSEVVSFSKVELNNLKKRVESPRGHERGCGICTERQEENGPIAIHQFVFQLFQTDIFVISDISYHPIQSP